MKEKNSKEEQRRDTGVSWRLAELLKEIAESRGNPKERDCPAFCLL